MAYEAVKYSIENLSDKEIKDNVLSHYGLEYSDMSQIKFKDTDKQRAVYKVEYSNKSYCLKKVYFNEQDLLFVYSSIEWLHRNNINVPKLLPTKHSGRYVLYKGMLFILTPWIEGSRCNYDNIDNILASSLNLAKMHKCSKNFSPIIGSRARSGFDDMFTSTQKHFNQILTSSNMAFTYKDKFSKTFLQKFDSNLILARNSLSLASKINSANLETCLCHMDYVNKNIIFDTNNDLWVIDFDKCRIDYKVHDISYFLRRLLKRDNTKWDIEIAINSLKQYEEILPINLDEYKYIMCYLCFPQKYWKISRDYYNNIQKCNKNAFNLLLNKTVEKTESQVEFMTNLKEYVETKFHTKL
ncbi:CotS family spore coat protein [Clostridium sp. 19966]|uniref:CotS family spore coat protein n=1 Tax=Clostridium sp. 19966 TaxID=2768166 RepID=UPI0028DFD7A0|nr:CotS family spore coat protein [Clostridium sp. 19966]MDT8715327.1 CotS family spore coat protein [Clostridium sp. 19966]